MATLLQPDLQEHPEAPAPDAEPEVRTRLCEACGTPMAADQDWCLACGTAAPGRLGGRPGLRSAIAVAVLTLLLVSGAVAASYAALQEDSTRQAQAPSPTGVGPVAQVPPAVSGPAPTVSTPAVPAVPAAPAGTTPAVPAPAAGSAPANPAPPAPSSSGSSSSSSGGSSTSSSSSSGGTTSGSSSSGSTKTTTGTTKTPAAKPTFTPVTLGADAADTYDPYGRATAKGDPADAVDGDDSTNWFVTPPDDGRPVQVGLVIDLDAPTTVRQLKLSTTSPGFRVEVYGADGSERPEDVLDARWEQVAAKTGVEGDEKLTFRDGQGEFRHVLIWITRPPASGRTARIDELQLLGPAS